MCERTLIFERAVFAAVAVLASPLCVCFLFCLFHSQADFCLPRRLSSECVCVDVNNADLNGIRQRSACSLSAIALSPPQRCWVDMSSFSPPSLCIIDEWHTKLFELSVIANIPHKKEVYNFISLLSLDRQILFEFWIKVISGGTGKKKTVLSLWCWHAN